jgi:hypothetical protein
MKSLLAAVVMIGAVAIWTWRLLPKAGPTESELQQTSGVSAEVVSLETSPLGRQVSCRVFNSTRRIASQVVLRVVLTDDTGTPLASNPLAQVIHIGAGVSRDAKFLVPFNATAPIELEARVEVSLVRWLE